MHNVQLVVTCTKGKRVEIDDQLAIRNYPNQTLEERIDSWSTNLRTLPLEARRAYDLYSGSHWKTIRTIHDQFKSVQKGSVDIWICSAGYGLVNIDSYLKPYAATFSPNQEDFVGVDIRDAAKSSINSTWWKGISKFNLTNEENPRSITTLMKLNPDDIFLFCLSPTYLDVIYEELNVGKKILTEAENLMIVSTGTATSSSKNDDPHILPTDGRIRGLVGGNYGSLNAKIVHMMLKDRSRYKLTLAQQTERLFSLTNSLDPADTPTRVTLSDEEVDLYLRTNLAAQGLRSKTFLLRQLRDSGFACEQKRFYKLYEICKNEIVTKLI